MKKSRNQYYFFSLIFTFISVFSISSYAQDINSFFNIEKQLGIDAGSSYANYRISDIPVGKIIDAIVIDPSKIGGCLKGDHVELINNGNGDWKIIRLIDGSSFHFTISKNNEVVKIPNPQDYYPKNANPTPIKKTNYFSVGGGGGGDANAGSISFEVGTAEKYLFGIGFTYIFNNDVPSDTLDYPVPHYYYTRLGKREDGEWGLYGTLGINVYKNIYLFGLGGASFAKEIELAQSNATGWYYTQSSHTVTYGMYGGGIRFGLSEKLYLQAEYDNRRGLTGLLSFVW